MKFEPGQIKKIAIFRALQLGDMLCTVPAMRALRQAFPDAEITLMGLPWAAQFVQRFNKYFNAFMHFPGYPGLPEQSYDEAAFFQFMEDARASNFDLVLQMQDDGTVVNELMPLFNAKHLAGYYNNESYKPVGSFIKYPNQGNEIHRHIKLMKHLGIPSAGDALEFPTTENDISDFKNLCLYLPPQKYVCINPGSRYHWRQWPAKYFAALGDICVENGLTVVITGTKADSDITSELIKCMHHPVIDLTGCTNIGAMALLLQNAYLLIANCTGVSHIASATKTKSIIISMDGEAERWAPLDKCLHTIIDCRDNHRFDEVLLHTADMIHQQQPSLKRA